MWLEGPLTRAFRPDLSPKGEVARGQDRAAPPTSPSGDFKPVAKRSGAPVARPKAKKADCVSNPGEGSS
jgi:hypothetical protein